MRTSTTIENIGEMRRRVGIDDVELRDAIAGLEPGEFVRLTFLPDAKENGGETLTVRITGIKGLRFQGVLVETPANHDLAGLEIGTLVVFTAGHIHSLLEDGAPRRRLASRK